MRFSAHLNFTKKSLISDFIAGVTVAVVALPLAIGFGITSGMTAASGITTAIIGGFIAALLGGSRFQVSGPTGAMTVVLIPVIQNYGTKAIPILGLMAGLIVLLMAFLRLGKIINKIHWAVVEGFTVGIALVIALQQLPYVFQIEKGEGDRTLISSFNTIRNALEQGINWKSLAIVVLTLFIKFNVVRITVFLGIKIYVPASFISLTFASLVVIFFGIDVARIGDIPRSIANWNNPLISNLNYLNLLVPAFLIALLVAIESLLSARVADSLAKVTKEKQFKPDQELFGQGFATAVASLFGGMPATGAIARTNVNVRSHAQTRMASIFHSLILLVIVLLVAPIFSQIPTAAIAGVLIGTSIRILNPVTLLEMTQTTKPEKIVFVITAVITVAVDLIWGISIGVVTYLIFRKLRLIKH